MPFQHCTITGCVNIWFIYTDTINCIVWFLANCSCTKALFVLGIVHEFMLLLFTRISYPIFWRHNFFCTACNHWVQLQGGYSKWHHSGQLKQVCRNLDDVGPPRTLHRNMLLHSDLRQSRALLMVILCLVFCANRYNSSWDIRNRKETYRKSFSLEIVYFRKLAAVTCK